MLYDTWGNWSYQSRRASGSFVAGNWRIRSLLLECSSTLKIYRGSRAILPMDYWAALSYFLVRLFLLINYWFQIKWVFFSNLRLWGRPLPHCCEANLKGTASLTKLLSSSQYPLVCRTSDWDWCWSWLRWFPHCGLPLRKPPLLLLSLLPSTASRTWDSEGPLPGTTTQQSLFYCERVPLTSKISSP